MAFLDATGLERLWAHIVAKLGNKVDKEEGKGLSSNDFTTEEKTKLSNISNSADSVSFTRSLTSGTKIGTITINGKATDMYCTAGSSGGGSSISASIVTADADGLVPMFDAYDGTINSQSTDWVLANDNGNIGWYKLPSAAFNNTTYTAGDGLDLSNQEFSIEYGSSASALGTSSGGSAATVSRSDHVHALPTPAAIGAATSGHTHTSYASTSHNHDGDYAAKTHDHSKYAEVSHDHSEYATTSHDHDDDYAAKTHSHSEYANSSHGHALSSCTGYLSSSSIKVEYGSSLPTSGNYAGRVFFKI